MISKEVSQLIWENRPDTDNKESEVRFGEFLISLVGEPTLSPQMRDYEIAKILEEELPESVKSVCIANIMSRIQHALTVEDEPYQLKCSDCLNAGVEKCPHQPTEEEE